MSDATTNQQALANFIADLRRLNEDPEALLAAADDAVVQIQEQSQAMKRQIGAAMASFIASKKDEVKAHVRSELAAKELTRLDAKPAAKALPAESAAKASPAK